MKTLLTTISLIIALSMHGQIGLGSLKSKAKEKSDNYLESRIQVLNESMYANMSHHGRSGDILCENVNK